jgi:hypothetical protein
MLLEEPVKAGIVERDTMGRPPTTMAELQALGAIAKARRDNLRILFEGAQLSLNKWAREKTVKESLSDGHKIYKGISSMIKGIQTGSKSVAAIHDAVEIPATTHEFLQICMDLDDINEVTAALTVELAQQLIHEVTPFIGVLTSGYKSVKYWRAVVKGARELYKSDYYLEGVLPGDPLAAAEAVKVVIERYIAANTIEASRNTAAAATKIAGLFADLGTATTAAVGAASALAKLILTLYELGRDWKEMNAGNKLLQDPAAIDLNVFKICPLLGCYVIACSDTSNVANFFVSEIGLPGWMDKVERLKKQQLDPLIKISNRAIVNSRLHLEGLKSTKGTIKEKGFSDKIKANVVQNFKRLIRSNASLAAGR